MDSVTDLNFVVVVVVVVVVVLMFKASERKVDNFSMVVSFVLASNKETVWLTPLE